MKKESSKKMDGKINCSQCTPNMFFDKTKLDIYDIFDHLKEGESKDVVCGKIKDDDCHGTVIISKVNDRLKIRKL